MGCRSRIRTRYENPPSNGACGPQHPRNRQRSLIMSLKTKIAALTVAAIAATGSVASTVTPAEAHGFHPGWGIGAGLVGAAVVGSAIAASNPSPYSYGYPRCGLVRQYDAFGRYIGTIRSCY